MANANNPFGFRLVDKVSGGVHNAQTQLCWVGSGDSTAIFLGDLVSINNASSHGNDGVVGTGAVEVKQADNTTAPLGVVIGINPIMGVAVGSENLNRLYRPASTAMYLTVCTDPDAIYTIQCSGTSSISDMMKFATIVASPVGSTLTGVSGMQLYETSVTSTRSGGQMLILGVDQSIDNAPNTTNTILRVKLVSGPIAP
jgi:hypothetical protein